jgi:arylsulfatase A
MTPPRRPLLLFATPLLLLLLLAAASASAAAPPPNMVFVLSDDLGFAEPSFMPRGPSGNRNISTPNIDALAQSGMVFTDAYAGEAVCAPSRNALMTGQHTGHTWIRGNLPGADGHGLPLRDSDTTFFELLRDKGYHVACVGKW